MYGTRVRVTHNRERDGLFLTFSRFPHCTDLQLHWFTLNITRLLFDSLLRRCAHCGCYFTHCAFHDSILAAVRRTTGTFEADTDRPGVKDVWYLPDGAGGHGEPVRPRGAARGAETAWDGNEKRVGADERVMDEPSRPLLLQKRHETRYTTLVTASWCGSSPYCAAWTGGQTYLAEGLSLSSKTTGSCRGPISRRSGVVGSTPTIGAVAALPAAGDAEADADASSFPADNAAPGISPLPAAQKKLVMG
jgi:hypothetical protein